MNKEVTREFKVNEYIILKLEDGKIKIYMNGEKFDQCKYLAFHIDKNDIHEYDDIQSIDELEQRDRSREFNVLQISPEEEFWGHFSNLQV